MEKTTYLTILYDYYGELFNEQQRNYFEEYYFQNNSLGEISENYNVSRSAVHKAIKSIEEKLNEYEEKLKLYKKSIVLDDIIKNLHDEDLKKKLEEIK
ncbi:MAG: HTH domain-containing protein [Bacilli bacterium]|nr:HTH domain-containing protein [Bacilli bacterium]MDD3304964.1 HTH domain-containing protein [Bacilli bacterium]MDD4054077.1 HTH domain-containing protein [Bacilli bacterium]MDD4411403.1 HTH domain-containing protein [Bacilli bacterium]